MIEREHFLSENYFACEYDIDEAKYYYYCMTNACLYRGALRQISCNNLFV